MGDIGFTSLRYSALTLATMVTSLTSVTMSGAGCVFPADEPTGIELSWRFVEVNDVDGEEASRIRSCQGARIETVRFEITDADAPTRSGTFEFDCETGYQTAEQFQTQSSDAFVQLDSGSYEVRVTGRVQGGGSEVLLDDTVDVLSRTLTVEVLELAREPVQWSFVLTGVQACEGLSVTLTYADPQDALADPSNGEGEQEADEGDTDGAGASEPVVYRETLRTDRDLPLAGAPVQCGDNLAGTHVVSGIDPGAYRLELLVGDTQCVVPVDIHAGATEPVIDLANLPCDG